MSFVRNCLSFAKEKTNVGVGAPNHPKMQNKKQGRCLGTTPNKISERKQNEKSRYNDAIF